MCKTILACKISQVGGLQLGAPCGRWLLALRERAIDEVKSNGG